MLTACSARSPQAATPTPLTAIDREISLELFMGDWFVLASIPIDIPFFSEADAYNGVESYVLTEDGTIDTTYAFRDGGFDGAERRFTPSAQVYDTTTNAEWRMQFLWPFRSAYLIVYLDEEYSKTIIGVPDRSHAWIMSRTPSPAAGRIPRARERARKQRARNCRAPGGTAVLAGTRLHADALILRGDDFSPSPSGPGSRSQRTAPVGRGMSSGHVP